MRRRAGPTGRETESNAALSADADRPEFSDLPWWRRPRQISRQLAGALVLTALLAVATFGGLNYVAAANLLVAGTQDQLVAVGAMRAASIEAGTQRLVSDISVASSDVFVGQALRSFTQAFDDLNDQRLTRAQREELEAWYQQGAVDPLNETGFGPVDVQDLLPRSRAGRWLQYQYALRPPDTPAPVDAGDGTRYSELNARLTGTLRAFSTTVGGGDVLLIDPTGTIVYSLDKRNDVGTNLVSGPYAGSALAQVVTDRLPVTRIGTTLLTDFTVSPSGRAALFAVSSVPDPSGVLGALAVEIPVEALNQLTATAADGGAAGLDEASSYIVSADKTLQSEPRAWQQDPSGYLEQLLAKDQVDQTEANLIELFGSPVGVQEVDTRPVQSAIDGQEFQGSAKGILGDATYVAAEPFNASDRQWVVVTEVPRSVALAPLRTYILRILIVLAIVLPIVAGFGIWLSRVLTRPIRPTVDAAAAIVAGERQPDVDTTRSDEFGDLARRLTAMAGALGAHETKLADEYQRTRQLLLAVLPPNLVDEDGQIVGTGEGSARATVVAVVLSAADNQPVDDHGGEMLRRAAQEAEQIASDTGLQRVRMAADRFLFLAGMDIDDPGAEAAIEFAGRLRSRLSEDGEDSLTLHIGLSTGPVATGLLDSGALTFGAWGEPVRRALALAALAQVDDVLIDTATAEACNEQAVTLAPAQDVVDLDDRRMDLFRLG